MIIITIVLAMVGHTTAPHPAAETVVEMSAMRIGAAPFGDIDDGAIAVMHPCRQRSRERETGEGADNHPGERGPNQNLFHRFLRSCFDPRKVSDVLRGFGAQRGRIRDQLRWIWAVCRVG